MVKIHGIAYILIGIFISTASYMINRNNLYIFFYGGMFFIAYGVAKIILKFITRQKEQQKSQSMQKTHQSYKKCHRCGNIAKLTDRFCSKCGTKMYASMLF